MNPKPSRKPSGSLSDTAPAESAGPDVSGLSFEQAMAELEQITKSLEAGALDLADALSAYQRGAALMRHGQDILNQVQHEIELIEAGQSKSVDRASLIAQAKD